MILLEVFIIIMIFGVYIGKLVEWNQFMKRFDKLETLVQQPLSGSDDKSSSPKCSHNEVEVWGDCTEVEPICICKKCRLVL